MRHLISLVILTVTLVASTVSVVDPTSVNAFAQVGEDWCGRLIIYQEDAQVELERVANEFPSLLEQWTESLDPDGNGVACDGLPHRPEAFAKDLIIRGGFGRYDDPPAFNGVGYAARYNVTVAGIVYDIESCPRLATGTAIDELLGEVDDFSLSYFIRSATDDPIPDENVDDTFDVVGLMWIASPDPLNPFLVNEWLLANGIARYDAKTAPERFVNRLQKAEASAKENGYGIWGSCELPDSAGHAAPEEVHVAHAKGSGDQIVEFTVNSGGVHKLSLRSSASIIFIDVYRIDGTWIPEFSISQRDGGTFESAGYLDPGSYYIQVSASGAWEISVDPIAGNSG